MTLVESISNYIPYLLQPSSILWLGALIGGIYGFLTISLSTLTRYRYNPTVVSLERNYKDWNTTLPAATVCPESKFDEDNLNSVLEKQLKHISDKEGAQEFLDTLAKLNYSTFNLLPNFPAILPTQYLEAVVNMRYNFEYTVSNSNIENEDLEEQELVLNVNEMGLCYSYNSQVAIYMNPASWKSGNYTHSSTSFSIVGNPLDGDIFTQVMNMDTAYTVYLHSPQEVPDIASKGGSAYEGSYKTQDVGALSIVSAPEIRDLTIAQRKCRFPEESNLALSPVYSYNLCRMECRMKLANKLCGCVPYFYKPSDDYKICDIKGMMCLTEHSEVLIKLLKGEDKIECHCLPPCDDVNFVTETENIMDWTLGTNLKWGLVKYPRERLRRDVLFGIADVLVAMGGTAGLFFGCSVLSLVEIFYFFSLRLLWFTYKKA
ncbi:hypothetical protein J6590_009763 [Homalodisca vitripennis]|nr:hypothetical protein J6590_009763 [Homalodisca vitripennis]